MGGWPVGYLPNAVEELNSGLPRTNNLCSTNSKIFQYISNQTQSVYQQLIHGTTSVIKTSARGGFFLGWTGPIEMDRSIWHSEPFSVIPVPHCSVFSVYNIYNMQPFIYGLLTADLSVLLVHPCAVTTGLLLLKPSAYFAIYVIGKKCLISYGKYLGRVCSN